MVAAAILTFGYCAIFRRNVARRSCLSFRIGHRWELNITVALWTLWAYYWFLVTHCKRGIVNSTYYYWQCFTRKGIDYELNIKTFILVFCWRTTLLKRHYSIAVTTYSLYKETWTLQNICSRVDIQHWLVGQSISDQRIKLSWWYYYALT